MILVLANGGVKYGVPVRPKSMERVEVTERKTIQEEREKGGGEAVGKDCSIVRAVHLVMVCINMFLYGDHTDLNTSITVVGRDNPILGKHKVDGATGLPPLEIDCHRGVGLCVPPGYFLKTI